ncbi:MAG: nitrilase-related carbon-nitrogen hydrolase [Anaerolineae bacterium]|nr:nitrilase [Anaerolineae bacterium]MDW8100064.1 nitrilase-related carbon-nitrogen hydrolase [Anaerolineae bacterium]
MKGVRTWLMARGVHALLRWKSRASLVRSALGRLSLPRARPIAGDRLWIGIAQTRLELVEDGASFAGHIGRLAARAVEQGAQLVVFPEDVGFLLLGLLPGARAAAQASNLEAAVSQAVGASVSIAELLRVVATGAWPIYQETFAGLARRMGAYILGGSIVLPDEAGRLYNVAFLFGPDGEIQAQQRKTHLFHIERDWGLEAGDEIVVCELPNTRIAFPICMDHTFHEPIRVAYLQGAEVIIDPSANPERYDEPSERRGVWSRVQESPAYGVLACLVGTLAGVVFEGRSQVVAPLALTPQGDGILAQAQMVDREEVVVAEVNLAALRAYKAAYGPQWNLALYRRYLPLLFKYAPSM